MRKTAVSLAVAMVCSLGVSACANESTEGLQVAVPEFSGSYLAPSLAFTASATPTPTEASVAPGGGPAPFNKSEIAELATKIIEPPKEDVWAGPFCKKYKVYSLFFDSTLQFNLPQPPRYKNPSKLTTGDPAVKQAITMVTELKPLAKDPTQKAWITAALAFYGQIYAGKPYYWLEASPYTDSSDTGEWVDTNNKTDIANYRDFNDFAQTYQTPMALCMKLR